MAVKAVFADTNYFCGLYNPKDTLNKKCEEFSHKLQEEGFKSCVSNYIVLEAMTILSQRVGKKASLSFWKRIYDGTVKVVNIDERLHKRAFKIFKKVRSKNFSFVDASILALMKRYKIDYLLTFDKRLIKVAKRMRLGIL